MAKTDNFLLRIDEDERRKLEEVATARGLTKAALVRALLEREYRRLTSRTTTARPML